MGSLADGSNTAIADSTIIILYHYHLPPDNCLAVVNDITQETASIVSDGSF